MQQHYNYLQSRHRFYDGVVNFQLNSIIATTLPQTNGLPWFRKVLKINDDDTIDVLWFYKHNDSIYYYLDNKPANVSFDVIICNDIEFEPTYNITLQ